MRACLLRGLVLLSCGMVAGAHAQPDTAVRAGQVAFHYWQDQDLAAVTQWMINRASPSAPSALAPLEQVDLLIRFGLDREAADVLTAAGTQAGAGDARDQAWLKLAQKLQRQGQSAQAEAALSQVRGVLPEAQQEAQTLLKAQLLMARADYRGAVQVLRWAAASGTPLVRYNLGVAQQRAGDVAEGAATLNALGQEPARTDEHKALRDRANVALGFAALKAGQPAQARTYLERVPLQGSASNKALLGYGWAAMDQQNPQSALVPWLTLSQRDAKDPAALEARLAVPYAYEQLGAKGKALQTYLDAVETFERERNSLDAALAFVKSGRLIDGLLGANAGLAAEADLVVPTNESHWAYLSAAVAQEAFQQGVRNLIDLRGLDASLNEDQKRLDDLRVALSFRQQRLAGLQDRFQALNSARKLADSRQRIAALAQEVGLAETRLDGVAFADAKQRDLLGRANRLLALVQKPPAGPEWARLRDRARLAAGVLNWQVAQDAPPRLAAAKQTVTAAQDDLAQAQAHEAAVARLLREGTSRLDPLATRVQAMAQRLEAQRRTLKAWRLDQEAALQAMATSELNRQKDTLTSHLAQARFAVARLYDEAVAVRGASGAGGADQGGDNKEAAHAPKP